MFMLVVLFVQFIMIPLDVAYFPLSSMTRFQTTLAWKWTRLIADSICLTDVVLNFVTGYYDPDSKQFILEPKKIAVNYLKGYFCVDFVSSLPTNIDVIIPISPKHIIITALTVCSVFRLLRLITFCKYFNQFAQIFDLSFVFYKTTILLMVLFICLHIVCCVLICHYAYKMGLLTGYIASEKSYRHAKDSLIANASYIGAYYKTVMILSNAGIGKTYPVTKTGVTIIITLWVLAKIFFIVILAKFSEIMKAKTSSAHKYGEMVRQLREYMRHKQLPEFMQRRLIIYYEFRFQKSYFRESEILATISGQLRQEIVMHSCRKLVENVAFFKNLPLNLLVRIVSCLRSEIFLTNDVIVKATTPGDSMFFIASGTVGIYTPSGREICHLEDGAHFGEIALVMSDELRVASVVAVEVCELYRLERRDFVRAIHPYPDLLENIIRIAADRMERTTMLDEHNRREMATRRFY